MKKVLLGSALFLALPLFLFSKECLLKDTAWKSSSTQCKNGFVHGKATAYHVNGKLKFEGIFKQGEMVKGTVFFRNKPYYIGPIVGNEMHGKGICYFKNKPETCEYYKGNRVDTIYKLRFLMRQQLLAIQAMLESQQANLVNEARYRRAANYQDDVSGSSTGSDIGSKVLNKVGEKVMDKILDNFF